MTEDRIRKLLSPLSDTVTGLADLLGAGKPSVLLPLMLRLTARQSSCDPDRMLSGLRFRRCLHPVLRLLFPVFRSYPHVIERRIQKPAGPVIWCPNHGFKDDVTATLEVARHAHVLFGSLPAFFNTFDGVGAWLNGAVLCNRKVKKSKQAALEACRRLLNRGEDLIIFPEGVWNKTPDKPILDLWPGIHRLARETGCQVVPVVHYLADPHKKYRGNVIHTVVCDPISMGDLTEVEGLERLRDAMATEYFLLMEKYGRTTRAELLAGFATADEAWESWLARHTGAVPYYDREIELCADYRSKLTARPEDVWQSVAAIRNIHAGNADHVLYARYLVEREKRRDFQRRF